MLGVPDVLLILSGEGPSDLGGTSEFGDRPGPMAYIIDQMLEDALDYSPITCGMVRWFSRAELSAEAKKQKFPKVALPGAKRNQGYLGHFKQAQALGLIAQRLEADEGGATLSVMFRDSDGTNSAPFSHWDHLTEAIEGGYKAADYQTGVAMVPKPKQESWLLCALKENPYSGCDALEHESGNDTAPNPLKEKLRSAVGFDPTLEDMCDWIESRRFDSEKLEMSSFVHFKNGMNAAIRKITRV